MDAYCWLTSRRGVVCFYAVRCAWRALWQQLWVCWKRLKISPSRAPSQRKEPSGVRALRYAGGLASHLAAICHGISISGIASLRRGGTWSVSVKVSGQNPSAWQKLMLTKDIILFVVDILSNFICLCQFVYAGNLKFAALSLPFCSGLLPNKRGVFASQLSSRLVQIPCMKAGAPSISNR